MTNSANESKGTSRYKKLGTVTSFKYLGKLFQMMAPNQRFSQGLHKATATLTKLKPIWRDVKRSPRSKMKLMHSLVISIFLYARESWILTAELEEITQAFEMRGYRMLLNISYKDHIINEKVDRPKKPLENMTNS